jgi:predicted RNA polymerase sigma factor
MDENKFIMMVLINGVLDIIYTVYSSTYSQRSGASAHVYEICIERLMDENKYIMMVVINSVPDIIYTVYSSTYSQRSGASALLRFEITLTASSS